MSKPENSAPAGLDLPNLDRCGASAHLRVGLVASTPLADAHEEASPELMQLIVAHRVAREAEGRAGVSEDEAQKKYNNLRQEPAVREAENKALEFNGIRLSGNNFDECKDHLFQCMEHQRKQHFNKVLSSVSREIGGQIEAALDAALDEKLSLIDKLFAEREAMNEACGKAAAEGQWLAAWEAQEDALMALCTFRCSTIREVRIKAEYLVEVEDYLDEQDLKAVLRVFAGMEA